jgi:hypothetical protein
MLTETERAQLRTQKAKEINDGLTQFYGTEHYYAVSPLFRGVVMTDGARWLAEKANCFWLMELIASYQPRCKKDKSCIDIQFWRIEVKPDHSCSVICDRDSNDEFLRQEIPFTDFPLDSFKIWVEAGACGGKPVMVILLPSEH